LGNYRDRLDIIADILNVVSREAKKTQIMYQANLSYKVLQRYLGEIVEASLILFENENQRYLLTGKGQEYLVAYKDYSKCSKTMEKRLNEFSSKRRILEDLCPSKNELTQLS
jgi:predicted transcriptional regulator